MMRAPQYWSNPPDKPGWQARLLAPLAAIYSIGTARRLAQGASHKAAVPVICVGNINAGGTGKTPTVIAVVQKLAALGVAAHAVSRGFGGSLAGPVEVDLRRHAAAEVGDEPLLLAAFGRTWVSKDRVAGVRAAEAAGAEAVVLDDGFQDPAVQKDLSLVVVDAAEGFGNGRVIPSGPLREPVETGLARADMVLAIGDEAAQNAFDARWGTKFGVPVVRGELQPLQTGMSWKGARVLAFAGIGRPAKFFATLRSLGAEILRAEALADHQPLTLPLMKRLEVEAEVLGAQLVTTEKDSVRLPQSFRQKVLALPVRLETRAPSALDDALARLFDE